MGYVKEILQNSSDSHQVSPSYVLTFTRWSNRDTMNYKNPGFLDVRKPMIVYSDAINVVTTDTKTAMSSTATVVLKCGDINYATAVHPGDFMLINLVNSEEEAQNLHDRALDLKPINKANDGFKGVYKIQNVVTNLRVDRATGIKTLVATITAASFTEFNNVIYYNPAIVAAFQEKGTDLYATAIGDYYDTNLKANSSTQNVVTDLFKILIGQSLKKQDTKVPNYGNTHFLIPSTLGALLGRPKIQYANEFFNYIIGVWKDSKTNTNVHESNYAAGFNPNFKANDNYFTTGGDLKGRKQVQLEDWNGQTAWSIVQANINSVLNEMYTTHRVAADGHVYPTIVVRQKPFTSEHYNGGLTTTKFFQVPRWRISANLLYDLQTSRNETARFNFVQVFTRALAENTNNDMAQQIELKNFFYDQGDIQRHGLRPYIQRSNFDMPDPKGGSDKSTHAKEWAEMVADWVIDGHLKESGVMTFQGIQEPVAVGDNLEFDGIIYHIEGVSHQMSIQGDKKTWTTRITVSYGMDMRSSKEGPVYPQMQYTDAQTYNNEDFNIERLRPGISDTQNISGRVNGEEIEPTKEQSFTPGNLSKKRKKHSKDPNTGES